MNDRENGDQLKKENDALKKRCALMEEILNHLHEGVLATDTDQRIVYFNRVEAENEGFQVEDVGKKVAEKYHSTEFGVDNPTADRVLKTGKPVLQQRSSYCSPKGKVNQLFYSCYPFFHKGKTEGVYTVSRPIFSDDPYVSAILAYEKELGHKNSSKSGTTRYFFDHIIGNSKALNEAMEQAQKISPHNMPVMIIGETGTGKEMFAQGIHNAGNTARGDFVAVNCAAVPETLLEGILFGVTKGAYTGAVATTGLFEQAENGSIFLDEVNSMPIPLQVKLLRVLQEKRIRPLGGKKEIPINCRIISSSSIDPFDVNGQNSRQIRTDLLFRLASATVYVPPLRERKEDIPVLCRQFIGEYAKKNKLHLMEISPLLAEKLSQYTWPGNVRELQNVIVSSLLNANSNQHLLEIKHLPVNFRHLIDRKQLSANFSFEPVSLKKAVEDVERKIIVEAILRYNGNISKAAKALQVTRPNLYNKIEKLGISELLSRS